ncbi:MAG: helix-turn-helix transcriptional regulator [bacterium]|nr:helix-turn-helix transcriptional regulator [bacterium]
MEKNQIQQFKAVDFQDYLKEQLKNPSIKKDYDRFGKQLEIAYQILQLRKKRGLSQKDLAQKIGTQQSDIARMETGQQNFTTNTLQKIAEVFGCNLKIEFFRPIMATSSTAKSRGFCCFVYFLVILWYI